MYCYDVASTNQPNYVNQSDCDGVWVGNDPSDDYWLGSPWNPYWNWDIIVLLLNLIPQRRLF